MAENGCIRNMNDNILNTMMDHNKLWSPLPLSIKGVMQCTKD